MKQINFKWRRLFRRHSVLKIIISVDFGPFGLFWVNLFHSIRFGPFGFLQSIMIHLVQFSPIWSCSD